MLYTLLVHRSYCDLLPPLPPARSTPQERDEVRCPSSQVKWLRIVVPLTVARP